MAGCRERMIGHNISVKWDVELVEVESPNWWEVGCCSPPAPPPLKKTSGIGPQLILPLIAIGFSHPACLNI